jgi:asparagine synthase (glutamine-hydrolysing)
MCGICGIVYSDRRRPAEATRLCAMRDALLHRGPDDWGSHTADGVALGSRRLAILDLSPRGHMPMQTADGRYTITYNGEIYNYEELRRPLEANGWRFRSNTDTEVLLALYAAEGPAMLDRLNGMFAFAIWDAERATLFAARDRLGVKPFYYRHQEDALYFASEEKALFAAGISPQFDATAWEELLTFRYVAGANTPFAGVNRLLPGHYLLFASGRMQIRRWWRFDERVAELRTAQPSEAARWFQETFDSAVALRRISDVPVGVLLSGGLDSGSVAASLAATAGRGVASFTVRFDEPGYDEGPAAREVAEKWHLEEHALTLTGADAVARLDRASWLNDEPLAHASDVHLNAIAEYAKPIVTVLLSGEGADELLGGYVRYQPLRFPMALAALRPALSRLESLHALGHRTRKLGRFLALPSLRDIGIFNACEIFPDDLRALGMQPTATFPYREQVWDDAERLFPKDLMRQAMFSDQRTFLPSLLHRNDRMTMGASIECRVPFLDYRLVEGVAALSSRDVFAPFERKHLLRQALGGRLPAAVRKQAKWGFGVPWSRYFRESASMRDRLHALSGDEPVVSGPFERAKVAAMVEQFLAGDDMYAALVRQLVMIATWYDECCGRARATPRYTAGTMRGSDPPAHRSRIASVLPAAPARPAGDLDPRRSAPARPASQSNEDRADRTAILTPRAR